MRIKTILRFLRPRYLLSAKRGRCTLCGRATLFVLTDTPETIRNHAICAWCGSSSRHRHIALLALKAFEARGITRLSGFGAAPALRVFNASTRTPIAKALGRGANIICSEYFDDVAPGETKNGVLNQDLTRLTFEDSSIDLLITEDVFEHIPDIKKAFRETHRVLKRGGFHIFSIPFYFDRKTKELFEWSGGKPKLHEPIEFHGDPVRGRIPCFIHIGYDMIDYLDGIGFDVEIAISGFAEWSRFGTFDCYTFVARKR